MIKEMDTENVWELKRESVWTGSEKNESSGIANHIPHNDTLM